MAVYIEFVNEEFGHVKMSLLCFILGDHEDAETADTSSQHQDDTVQTEEPADLVTF